MTNLSFDTYEITLHKDEVFFSAKIAAAARRFPRIIFIGWHQVYHNKIQLYNHKCQLWIIKYELSDFINRYNTDFVGLAMMAGD